MEKRVLLITTSFEDVSLITAIDVEDRGLKLAENNHYPVGLAYLHSYIESDGNKCTHTCLEPLHI